MPATDKTTVQNHATQENSSMTISFSVSKKQLYYVLVVLEFLVCAWWFGIISVPGISSGVTMTQTEHELCISALEIFAQEVEHYSDGNAAKRAYLENCPIAIRARLGRAIGSPPVSDFVAKTYNILQKTRIE